MGSGNGDFNIHEYLELKFKDVKDDFGEVHRRLDITNGQVRDHSTKIAVLQDHDKDVVWLKRAVGGLVLTIIGAVIVGFITGKI